MSYLENARQEMKNLADYLDTWMDSSNYWRSTMRLRFLIDEYNHSHNTHFIVRNGATRVVIIGSDYVIKVDYCKQDVKNYGGCYSEWRAYSEWKDSDYGYLLCPITKIKIGHHYYYCMPRVDTIGNDMEIDNIDEYISVDEQEWIDDNFADIHNANWGMLNDKVMLIDYAFNRYRRG